MLSVPRPRSLLVVGAVTLGCAASPARDASPPCAASAVSNPKLDPEVAAILQRKACEREAALTAGDAARAEIIDGAPIDLEVVVEGDIGPLIAAGLPLPNTREPTLRASLSFAQIRALVTFPQVLVVQRPQTDSIK